MTEKEDKMLYFRNNDHMMQWMLLSVERLMHLLYRD
jgi:hypothetical protein